MARLAGHSNCYSDTVAKGNQNNVADLEDLEMQVLKARKFVHQSELKVEAIEASIHEIEKFHPKIIHRPVRRDPTENVFSVFAENALWKAG